MCKDLAARVATVREKLKENEFFPGLGKIRKFYGWTGKFGKDFEIQGKVREYENQMAIVIFRNCIYTFQGERMLLSS